MALPVPAPDHLRAGLVVDRSRQCPARRRSGLRLVDDGHHEGGSRGTPALGARAWPQRVRRLPASAPSTTRKMTVWLSAHGAPARPRGASPRHRVRQPTGVTTIAPPRIDDGTGHDSHCGAWDDGTGPGTTGGMTGASDPMATARTLRRRKTLRGHDEGRGRGDAEVRAGIGAGAVDEGQAG
jgi:hypothetical protein